MPVIAKSESLYLSSPEDLLSRHHVPGFIQQRTSVLVPSTVPLNGSTLDHSLFIFRAHHRACAERRKNGLSYELQLEAFRTGKYLQKLDNCSATKHQQQHSSVTSKGVENTSSKHPPSDREPLKASGGEAEPMETNFVNLSPHSPNKVFKSERRHSTKFIQSQDSFNNKQSVDVKTKPGVNHNGVPLTTAMTIGMSCSERQESKPRQQSDSYGSKVLVKTEPSSGENTPRPCTRSPTETCPKPVESTHPSSNSTKTLTAKSNCNSGPPKAKRRRYSIPTSLSTCPLRSSSFSDDAGDDLSLSAEDCISGVISTPPIKPLEEEEDRVITTPSPVANPPPIGNKSISTSSTNSVSRSDVIVPYSRGTTVPTTFVATTTNSNVQQQLSKNTDSTYVPKDDSLSQDLDDFSQVLEMITQEQNEIERQASLTPQQQQPSGSAQSTDVPQRHFQRPCVVSPPPYYPPATQQSVGNSLHNIPRLPSTSYHKSSVQPYRSPITSVPRRVSDGQLYPSDNVDFIRHSSHQQSLMDGGRVHKHPQSLRLPELSSRIDHQQHVLVSPSIRSTAHTPTTTPGYQDTATHVQISTAPTVQHPQTPTTPLEHFSAFTLPTPQGPPHHVQSPTQSHQFFPQTASTFASYQYSQSRALSTAVSLSSPVGLPGGVGLNWPHPMPHPQLNSPSQQGSLKETLLAQVNSRLERITGQKHTPGQDTLSPHMTPGPPLPGAVYPHTHGSFNDSQLESKYTAVATTVSPVVNSTGPPLSHTLTYQNRTPGGFPHLQPPL